MGLFFLSLVPTLFLFMVSNNLSEKDMSYDKNVKGFLVEKIERKRPSGKNRNVPYWADRISYVVSGDTMMTYSYDVTNYEVGDSIDLVYSESAPEKAVLKSEKLNISNEEVKLAGIIKYPMAGISLLLLVLGIRQMFIDSSKIINYRY